jgi:hypothetical protein
VAAAEPLISWQSFGAYVSFLNGNSVIHWKNREELVSCMRACNLQKFRNGICNVNFGQTVNFWSMLLPLNNFCITCYSFDNWPLLASFLPLFDWSHVVNENNENNPCNNWSSCLFNIYDQYFLPLSMYIHNMLPHFIK